MILDVRPEDAGYLRAVCRHYLYDTRWAGELGDPLPPRHRASKSRKTKLAVTHIRRARRVCHAVVGKEAE